jgi:hypothetical protein
MDTHIISGDRIKPFYVVIHNLAEIFQYAVHYVFANFNIIPDTAWKRNFLTEIYMQLLESFHHLHKSSG